MNNQGRYLPILVLEGTKFYFDYRLQELRQVDLPWNSISFRHFEYDATGDRIQLWYSTDTKNAVLLHPGMRITKSLRCLEFDSEVVIDPIAVGIKYANDPDLLLHRFPFKPIHYSIAIPLAQTLLPAALKVRHHRSRLLKAVRTNNQLKR